MQVSATSYHMDLFNRDILEGIKDDTSLRIAGASQSDSVLCEKNSTTHLWIISDQTRVWPRRY